MTILIRFYVPNNTYQSLSHKNSSSVFLVKKTDGLLPTAHFGTFKSEAVIFLYIWPNFIFHKSLIKTACANFELYQLLRLWCIYFFIFQLNLTNIRNVDFQIVSSFSYSNCTQILRYLNICLKNQHDGQRVYATAELINRNHLSKDFVVFSGLQPNILYKI